MIKALIAVLAIAITAFYFFWNPASNDLLLVCPFKKMTGFYCAGCGGQRAFHYLLHGEFSLAFKHNLLIFLALPFGVLKLLIWFYDPALSDKWVISQQKMFLFWGILILFTILRNIPASPFHLLAP